MTTTAYAYPARNKLISSSTPEEFTVIARRSNNPNYINIAVRPVNPQPDSRNEYEVGSYYLPYKSFRIEGPGAAEFKSTAERLVAKLLAKAASATARTSASAAPITDAEVRAIADAARARAAAMIARGEVTAEGCGCPGICRACGSRCYGDCHQR